MTNVEVIAGLQQEEDAALVWLNTTYRRRCVGYLVQKVMKEVNTTNRERADALFVEALIALTTNVRSGRLTSIEADIGTYLTAIMRFKYIAEFSKVQRPPLAFDYTEPVIDEEIDLLRRGLRRHLRELGNKCRQILTLFYYDNLPYKEIVKLTDYPYADVTAARMQRVRCVKKLREKLQVGPSKKSSEHDA